MSVLSRDGVTQSYTFDDMDRLTDEVVTGIANNLIASFRYDLRADGQRTAETEQVPDGSGGLTTNHITWQYDGLNRLVSETYDAGNNGLGGAGDYVDTYTCDPVGSDTGVVTQTFDYDTFGTPLVAAATPFGTSTARDRAFGDERFYRPRRTDLDL